MRIVRVIGSAALALCAGAIAATSAGAQAPVTEPTYVVDRWTTADGLPQNTVTSILQTRDGYIWIGTFGGLVRFDGVRFTLVARHDHPGLASDRILALAESADGALWVGTEDGLSVMRGGTFRSYTTREGLPYDVITAVYAAPSGTVWVGTDRAGIASLSGDSIRAFGFADGMPHLAIGSIRAGRDGTIWVSTGQGVVLLNAQGDANIRTGRALGVNGTEEMLLADDSTEWFRTPTGLARRRGGHMVVMPHAPPDTGMYVTRIAMAHDGTRWVGTFRHGLRIMREPGSNGRPWRLDPITDTTRYRTRAMLVDREGNLWVGTDTHGLLRVRQAAFSVVGKPDGLASDATLAVMADRRGRMWVGTNCEGLSMLSGRAIRNFHEADGLHGLCVWSLAEGPDGTIWAGSFGGGLQRLRNGRWERVGVAQGLADPVILSLLFDRDGQLWAGTERSGVAVLRQGAERWVTYDTVDGLAHENVKVIRQTRDGDVWFGTLGGLTRLHEGAFTTYTTANGLSGNHVRAIYEDADGVLWIGTYGGGLTRMEDGRFTAITAADGLFDNIVSSILEDDDGRLWIGSNRGVFHVRRRELNEFTSGTRRSVQSVPYGISDGLRSVETNGGFQPSAWKSSDGRLWFPTIAGVAVVDPRRLRPDTIAPTPVIERLVVNNVVQAGAPATGAAMAGSEPVFGPGNRDVELSYTGLSFANPAAVVFRYRLDGLDEAWVDAGTRRTAYFPHLEPGHYSLQVMAANRDGVWSAPSSPIAFTIAPTWWQHWLFRTIALLAAAGMVAALIQKRINGLRVAQRAQQEFSRQLIAREEGERKRLAAELHDGLTQDLLVMKNRALLALQGDPPAGPARQQLEVISSVATDALASVRQIARNLRPHQLDRLGLSAAIAGAVESAGAASGTRFTSEIDAVDGILTPEAEIGLYRIVQEALSNVLKHSNASSAHVSLSRGTAAVRLVIADDGAGFVAGAAGAGSLGPGGHGLTSIAERAQLVGGSAAITSARGHGTRVDVSIPLRA